MCRAIYSCATKDRDLNEDPAPPLPARLTPVHALGEAAAMPGISAFPLMWA